MVRNIERGGCNLEYQPNEKPEKNHQSIINNCRHFSCNVIVLAMVENRVMDSFHGFRVVQRDHGCPDCTCWISNHHQQDNKNDPTINGSHASASIRHSAYTFVHFLVPCQAHFWLQASHLLMMKPDTNADRLLPHEQS